MPGLGPIVVSTGAAAADRRTFAELKGELARTYNPDDPNTMAVAGDSIRAAIQAFNRCNWPWEVLTHQGTLAANAETMALPQPFKAPLSAHILQNGRKWKRLAYMPYETYLAEYDLTAVGEPRCYSLQNQFESGLVTFWPRAMGTAYSVEIDYYRRTPIPKADNDPMEMPGEAEEAVMQWAFWEFCKRLGGEFLAGRIAVAKQDAMQARAELVAHVALRGDSVGVV